MSKGALQFAVMVGSLRKGSYNAAIARALPALAPDGVTIAPLGSVGDFPLYNVDVQEEKGFPSAATAMAEAIRAADGVIFVTPEYNHSIPGVLNNVIDWLSRVPDQPFAGKPVAIRKFIPRAVWGRSRSIASEGVFVFLDARPLNKPEVIIPQVTGKIDVEKSEIIEATTRGFVVDQLRAFAAFARERR